MCVLSLETPLQSVPGAQSNYEESNSIFGVEFIKIESFFISSVLLCTYRVHSPLIKHG